jgi:hypothetical protein
MLKFISAVIAAAAFAGVLTLLSATSTRLDARPARDAAPQSTRKAGFAGTKIQVNFQNYFPA